MADASLLTRTLSLGSYGKDVDAAKRVVYRGLDSIDGGRRLKKHMEQPLKVRRTFGPFFRTDVNRLRGELAMLKNGQFNKALLQAAATRGYPDALAISLFNQYADEHKPPPPPAVPNLGPIYSGGKSVLDHDCTHETYGINLYPAFDDAFQQGRSVIAPEGMRVTSPSNSMPGLAFYATGDSKLQYWFGHLDRTHSAGTRFRKGDFVGRVAPNHVGGGPHCHVGVNVELLWGDGKQLLHRDDYRHGAPTIRVQLVSHNG